MPLNAKYLYEVEIEDADGGSESALRERFTVCAARRLQKIEGEAGYPQVGQSFD
jgi:hypothetical protein